MVYTDYFLLHDTPSLPKCCSTCLGRSWDCSGDAGKQRSWGWDRVPCHGAEWPHRWCSWVRAQGAHVLGPRCQRTSQVQPCLGTPILPVTDSLLPALLLDVGGWVCSDRACREAVLRAREVVLSNYHRGRSHSFLQCRPSSCTAALSAAGPGRQWFHSVCLLLATAASCSCLSAGLYLQKNVVSIADSHSFCKQLGRNKNRKYFERKVYFRSRTETTTSSLKNRWLTEVKYS